MAYVGNDLERLGTHYAPTDSAPAGVGGPSIIEQMAEQRAVDSFLLRGSIRPLRVAYDGRPPAGRAESPLPAPPSAGGGGGGVGFPFRDESHGGGAYYDDGGGASGGSSPAGGPPTARAPNLDFEPEFDPRMLEPVHSLPLEIPLEEWSSLELAGAVRSLGVADIFHQTAAAIERNGLTGAALLEYTDLNQLMDDLQISSRLHRHVLTAKLDGWRRARGVALQPTAAVLARLQSEADELRAANAKLQAKTQMLDVVDGTLALREEQGRLREALAAEAAALREQNAKLQAKYDEASARRDGYSKTDAHHVEAREAMLAELASERAALEKAKAETAAQTAALSKISDALRGDEDRLRECLEKFEEQKRKQESERSKITAQIQAERYKADELRANQKKTLEKQEEARIKYDEKTQQMVKERNEFNVEKQYLKQCAEELAADRECLENENEKLNIETATVIGKLSDARATHSRETEQFKMDEAEKAKLVAVRERELSASRKENEKALNEKKKANEDEAKERDRMVREKKAFADEITLLEHCLARQRTAESELRDETTKLRADIEQRDSALRIVKYHHAEEQAAFETKRAELMAYLEEARTRAATLDREKAEFETQRDATIAEASAVAARRADDNARHGGEQAELTRLIAFVDEELVGKTAARERAAEALAQATARLKSELETRVDISQGEIAQLRDDLAKREQQLEYLEETIDEAERAAHHLDGTKEVPVPPKDDDNGDGKKKKKKKK